MKNKLTIMNERQEITDEELERFKDFDALLAKHQETIISGSTGWKRWIIIGWTLVVGTIVVTYFLNREEVIPAKNPEPTVLEKTEPTHDEIKSNPDQPQLKQSETTESKTNRKQSVEEEPAVTIEQKPVESEPSPPIYVQAEPVDGFAKLYEYFNRELIYPQAAVEDSIQGILTVSFIISRDGSAANIQFTNSLGKPFEEEATRLIQSMPAWKPATVNGNPVPSKMTLPLTFQIKNNTERNKE